MTKTEIIEARAKLVRTILAIKKLKTQKTALAKTLELDFEARNDALRSIARRRDLPEKDVAALIAYLRTADNAMRIERVAALKNDVMNLLRSQEPPVEGLAETLSVMFEGRPVAGFGWSGRAGVTPPAADGDGTP